jgi:predicted type IV restriction endonuclease
MEKAAKKPIIAFVRELKTSRKMLSFDEASTKQAVVLRLLSLLGWNIFDVEEVAPDYSSDGVTVSYALSIDGKLQLLLDVKRNPEDPDGLRKQLVALSTQESVELCAYTDGPNWWFYLTSARGGFKQKQCHSIDMLEEKPEEAAADLIGLLSREKVAGGSHIEAANAAIQIRKRKLAAEMLPEAWNRVLSEPNKTLVEILNDAAEALCGFRAEPAAVDAFIRRHRGLWLLEDGEPDPGPQPPSAKAAEPTEDEGKSSGINGRKPEFFADKAIDSFTFQGKNFPVKSWEQMLTALCNQFAASHAQEFEKVLWMYDDHQPCFSRYSDQLRIPEKIRKTNIYVETKLTADEIVKTVGDLMTEFGYGHEELVITTR